MSVLQIHTPPPLVALGFDAVVEVTYLGPATRLRGGYAKVSRDEIGYSEVLDRATGRVSTVRNDLLVIAEDPAQAAPLPAAA